MGILKFILASRMTVAAFREAKPIARRLSVRIMMLFASGCVVVGAIASLFWALHEVLFQLIGSGWSAIATSFTLWLFAWALWELAWRLPLRPRPRRHRPARRRSRPPAARSRH
jgi:hypothetical protein